MLSIIIFICAIAALLASLYKDLRIERSEPSVIKALHIHHFAQGVLVILAFCSVLSSNHSEKELRIAQLEANAAISAAKHFLPIYDQYFLELLPSAVALNNYFRYKKVMNTQPPEVAQCFDWNRVASVSLKNQRDNGLKAFAELQKIARAVLSEQAIYGEQYPKALVNWAMKTIELKEEQLPLILSTSSEAVAYAELTGRGVGFSVASAQNALKKLEK